MNYDAWLQQPYMIDKPHYEGCAWHEDNDPADDAECVCMQLDQEARAYAAEAKFDEAREI